MSFLKDLDQLKECPLAPASLTGTTARANLYEIAAANVYNRVGGLLGALSVRSGIDVANIIAVWLVESGGRAFTPKRAPIRFEVHQFFEAWGKRNNEAFEKHFRFGGHTLQPGHPWENQEFRTEETAPFSAVHHNQNSEYAALTLAQVLGEEDAALRSTSIGGCQILMSSYPMLGYESARAMYDAFQTSERAHVLGFFDFCQAKPAPKVADLLTYLKTGDWAKFAKFYNGPGLVETYSEKLKTAFDAACGLLEIREAA